MKPQTKLMTIVSVIALSFGTLSCGQSRANFGSPSYTSQDKTQPPASSTGSQSPTRSARSSRSGGDLSDLRGTHWLLIDWGAKANPYHSETNTNMQFCKDGTWAGENYGGGDSYQEHGGSYRISGDYLSLNDENGGFTGDYHLVSRNGDELSFESDDGYSMRLRYVDSNDCSR